MDDDFAVDNGQAASGHMAVEFLVECFIDSPFNVYFGLKQLFKV